ncbi:metal ABC transporter permease [Candidatus Microgenomates bacterium]|nr:metal ABC transporter permease [Candidatus Microgenomates bacterium]
MWEIFQYGFMIRAFMAGLAIAITAPLIGNFLVLRRYSLIADTLSHAALVGVAIGFLTHTSPLITTVITTVVISLCIEYLRSTEKLPSEAILGMFLPAGLAISIVLVALSGGLNSNLLSYLFGSIATVSRFDLLLIISLALFTVLTVIYFFPKLLFTSFDEESARVAGVPVRKINFILIIITALCISLAIRIVGVLLIGALMVIPVLTSLSIARSFKENVMFSVLFAVLAVICGLVISYYANLPAGGVIVIVSLIFFIFGLVFKNIR